MGLKVEGGGLPGFRVQEGKLDFEDSWWGKMDFFPKKMNGDPHKILNGLEKCLFHGPSTSPGRLLSDPSWAEYTDHTKGPYVGAGYIYLVALFAFFKSELPFVTSHALNHRR